MNQRYAEARRGAVVSTVVGGAMLAAGIGLAAMEEAGCSRSPSCDTQGQGLLFIVAGAWGATVPIAVAGIESVRMNHLRRNGNVEPLVSAGLVLPSIGVTVAAFALYPVGDPGVAAALQVSGVSVALLNAVLAVGTDDHPFSEHRSLEVGLSPMMGGGAIVGLQGSF